MVRYMHRWTLTWMIISPHYLSEHLPGRSLVLITCLLIKRSRVSLLRWSGICTGEHLPGGSLVPITCQNTYLVYHWSLLPVSWLQRSGVSVIRWSDIQLLEVQSRQRCCWTEWLETAKARRRHRHTHRQQVGNHWR